MKTLLYQVFFVTVFFICNEIKAQVSFKYLFEKGYNPSIQQSDSAYFIFDRDITLDFIKLDLQGSILQSKRLQSPGNLPSFNAGSNNFIAIENHKMLSSIYKSFSSGIGIAIFSFDLNNSNLEWYQVYNHVAVGSINYNTDKSFFLSSVAESPTVSGSYYPSSILIDSLGGLLRSYLFNNQSGISKFSFFTADKKIISALNIDTSGATISKYDTIGMIIWAKSYFRPKAAFHATVQNIDGTITVLGSPDTISAWMSGGYYHTAPLFLMKIDTAGTVLWCKSYGDNNFSFTNLPVAQLKACSDGGYLICSTIQNKSTIDNDLIIIKTDANGDTLWTRTHGSAFSQEFGNDISETSDSGYIVAGYTNSTYTFTNGGYYIIKTDSLGMTSTHCEEFNTPFAVNNITPNDSNVTLNIITGVVTAGSSSVNDTTISPPTTADGCMLNSIGQPQGSFFNKALAYPNPTQGTFQIKTNATYKPTVTVYDATGKQLFEKQYNNADEVKLDLNPHGKGVYSVRIVDGKTVRYSKVVVE